MSATLEVRVLLLRLLYLEFAVITISCFLDSKTGGSTIVCNHNTLYRTGNFRDHNIFIFFAVGVHPRK